MAEATDTYGILYQNLIDADCDNITIEMYEICSGEKKRGNVIVTIAT